MSPKTGEPDDPRSADGADPSPVDPPTGDSAPAESAPNPQEKASPEALNKALRREVAERKRFEGELRRSEAFLSAVLGALPSRIAVLDEKGTIMAVNTAWERFAGADPLGFLVSGLGANYLDACEATGTDDGARVAAAARDVLAGRRRDLALEIADRQGRWQALRLTAFDSSGQRRLVLVIDDISQRKRAEAALRQSTERTRRVLDSAVDGIITIDERGHIESMNPAGETIFGYRAEEVLGQNVKVLMPSPYQEEHDTYIQNYLSTGVAKIIGIGREVVGRRKDGSTFPMDLAVSEFHLDGRRSFMGSVRDITERKEIDEALRRQRDFAESLIDTAQTIVLVLGPDGTILRFNRHLEDIAGHRFDDVVGEDWFQLFLPEDGRQEERRRFKAVLAGQQQGAWSGSLRTRSGETRQIEWQAKGLLAVDGSVLGILWTGQDITDRLELETQLRQIQKMEAIGQLAGGVAHDFNTLLGAILGYSEMLLGELEASNPQRRAVEQIFRGAQRGAGLTRQLLAFSRRQVLQPTLVDLNTVVGDLRDMLHRLIGENVALELETAGQLGTVEVDIGQIEQVVINLVVNAADAIGGGGRIVVGTANRDPEPDVKEGPTAGPHVALTVLDTGCGMGEEVRRRAFDPFFTTKGPGKGTGLGLSTVYGIVRQSGGVIRLDSSPGKGARFEVLLPQVVGQAAAAPSSTVPEPDASGVLRAETSDTEERSVRVVLVEDDSLFRELLTEVLEAQGYDVVAAADPQQALELAKETEPDLLVSDLVMPGMSGGELAQVLLQRLPSMRVLLMSGYSDEALESRGALAGGHAFLQKPFGTRDFARTVRLVLEGREPGDES